MTILRYAITSRALFAGDCTERQAALLEQSVRWVANGIDIIQLREKDLPAAILVDISRKIIKIIGLSLGHTRLLLSSRPDVAIAAALGA